MFACQHDGIIPDLMAVSKGLTGGYMPLAATLTTEDIYKAFLGKYEEFKTFFHGHSYTGNPLGCAVALANLEVFRKEATLATLSPKIRLLTRLLRDIATLPHVGETRQVGLMAGIELVQHKPSRTPYPIEARTGHRVAVEARRAGLLLRPLGNVIVFVPPLSIAQRDLRRALSIIRSALASLSASA
jgi:adenosylmethionine-8-amino-7-oxononanoate aminotransferase